MCGHLHVAEQQLLPFLKSQLYNSYIHQNQSQVVSMRFNNELYPFLLFVCESLELYQINSIASCIHEIQSRFVSISPFCMRISSYCWAAAWYIVSKDSMFIVEPIKFTRKLYDSFHCTCLRPQNPQNRETRFLGISRYKFELRSWFNLNLYREMWVCRFGGFRGCSIFSGNYHMRLIQSRVVSSEFNSEIYPLNSITSYIH